MKVLTESAVHSASACLVFLDIGLPEFRHLAFCIAAVCALKFGDDHPHVKFCASTWHACTLAYDGEVPKAATFLECLQFFEHQFLVDQHPRVLRFWKLLEIDGDIAAQVLPFAPCFPPSIAWRQVWFQYLESCEMQMQQLAACVLQHYSADLCEDPLASHLSNCIRLMRLPGRWFNFACNGPRVTSLLQHTPRLFKEVCCGLAVVWGRSFEATGGSFELAGVGAEDPAGVLVVLLPYVNSPDADQGLVHAIESFEADSPTRQFFAHPLRWTWIRGVVSISLERTAIFAEANGEAAKRANCAV